MATYNTRHTVPVRVYNTSTWGPRHYLHTKYRIQVSTGISCRAGYGSENMINLKFLGQKKRES
jgi:hypothetical protein